MVQDTRYPQVGIDLKDLKAVVDAIRAERGGASRSEIVRDLLHESPTVIAKLAELSKAVA